MTSPAPQHIISAACEEDLIKYGDSFRGVGYTKSPEEAAERCALMLGVVRDHATPVTILDLGCGLGHLLDFIESHADYRHPRYAGLDISSMYLNAARTRHLQHEFILMDVLEDDEQLPVFDYVVLNGIFNYRGPIERSDMLRYWQQLTTTAYRHCRLGMAFNVITHPPSAVAKLFVAWKLRVTGISPRNLAGFRATASKLAPPSMTTAMRVRRWNSNHGA